MSAAEWWTLVGVAFVAGFAAFVRWSCPMSEPPEERRGHECVGPRCETCWDELTGTHPADQVRR